jgi:hypothetical protein
VLLSRHQHRKRFMIPAPEQAPSLNPLLPCILPKRICEFHHITSLRRQKDSRRPPILLFPHNHCPFLVATQTPTPSESVRICQSSTKMLRTGNLSSMELSEKVVKFTHPIIENRLGLCLELGQLPLLKRLMSHRHMAMTTL